MQGMVLIAGGGRFDHAVRQSIVEVATVALVFRATPSRRVQIGVGATLILAAWAPLIERAQSGNRVLDGISMSGIDISGLDEQSLVAKISPLSQEIATQPLRITVGTQEYTTQPASIGVQIDLRATVQRALETGFDTNPVAAAAGLLTRQFDNDQIQPIVRYDEAALQALIDQFEQLPAVTLREGSLSFKNGTVHIVSPRAGSGFDRQQVHQMIVAGISDPRFRTIAIPIARRQPSIPESSLQAAAQTAQALLARERTIHVGTRTLPLSQVELASALRTRNVTTTVSIEIDSAALRRALAPELAAIETAPRDATWSVHGNHATIVPSRAGSRVPVDAIASQIMAGKSDITVSPATIQPAHNTAWAQRMDIKEVIGQFTTRFPKGETRITNIRVAAKRVNGSVVEPGKVFSLNERLGERTLEKGYVVAHSIAADLSFEDTVGGGVSQVSTTLYNATYAAGLVDIEHTAHSIYISRYPLGREATLAWPSTDNRFRNDLPTGVLIHTQVRDDSITVTIFGNMHGRRVIVSDPIQLKEIEITTNARCKVNKEIRSGGRLSYPGTPGYEVEYSREIIEADGARRTERRNARYQMRPNRCEVGPDTPTENPTVSSAATSTSSRATSTSSSSSTSAATPTSKISPTTTTTTTTTTTVPPTTTTTAAAPDSSSPAP